MRHDKLSAIVIPTQIEFHASNKIVLRYTLLSILMLLLIGCSSNESTLAEQSAVQAEPQMLPMSIVETLRAGREGVVTLGEVDVADGAVGQVIAVGSYGIERFEGRFRNGVAKVLLSAEFTQRAGHITLFGSVGEYTGQTELTILAGKPIGPLTTLVGPRNILANNRAWNTAVIIPFDPFYNPVPDGTPLTIEASRPDGSLETYHLETNHLLAWQKLYSSTTAGRSRLATHTDTAFGPEATFEETPDEPTSFTISADKQIIPADGQQLIHLRTELLHDRYNNTLLDGTLVTFLIDDSNSTRRIIPAYTLDGIAEITIQAATLAGEATIQAVVSQQVSDPLTLQFVASEVRVPLETKLNGRVLTVVAGPILGKLQQYLPDGTEAQFIIANAAFEGDAQTSTIDNGFVSADFRIENLPAGDYTLTVIIGDNNAQATFRVANRQSDSNARCTGTSPYQICFDALWLQFR